MRKSRFTTEQIVAILQQQDAGVKATDLCRQHGITQQTLYRWKKMYGGMQVSEAQRLKQLEEENRRLKRIVAELTGERVTRVLDRLATTRGLLTTLVCDNGPEFRGLALDQWAHTHGVTLHFIDPGKPVQNAYVESFNGRFRDECLNSSWFVSLDDARGTIELVATRLQRDTTTQWARRTNPAGFCRPAHPRSTFSYLPNQHNTRHSVGSQVTHTT